MTTPATPPDLRAYTGYLLRRAWVRSTGLAQACMEDDTRLREVAALAALAGHGPIAQRRLGELCRISPTLIVKLVDELERKGWVRRERDAADRRISALRLTPEGASELPRLRAALGTADAELSAGLSTAETDRLKRHLTALLDDSPVLDAGELVDDLGYLIAHAHRMLRDRGSRRLAELDLHPRDFGLLTMVARDEPCTQAHLAERLEVSPPAILALLDALEARDLVRRVRSEEDRRRHEVTLTPHGREVLARAQRAAGGIQHEIAEQLGPDADVDLRALLTKVIGRGQEAPARRAGSARG